VKVGIKIRKYHEKFETKRDFLTICLRLYAREYVARTSSQDTPAQAIIPESHIPLYPTHMVS
jgi:hypothetical protein